ncbi:DUF1877 family protein [Nocardia sp. NPDC050713]|uniref:DUF1877 family protein n=1 Tax=Nocardia sp. NPDC050713 TaxID=3154511 RepID=UPI0033D8DCA1
MAQATWLQAVSSDEIHALRQDPTSINRLDKPGHYRTHYAAALNYFLTGEAWPGPEDHELWSVVGGADSIACSTLENGAFSVVSPDQATALAARLATVDVLAVETAVRRADFDELVDEHQIYELELITPEEGPGIIVAELEGLTAFYAKTAESKLGVVMYTT